MSKRYKTQRLHLLNTWEKRVVMPGCVEGGVITELFRQAGPGGSVRVVMGGCRFSTEWFLFQKSQNTLQHALGCRPSSPSGDLVAVLAATLLCFSNKLWEQTSLLSAAQTKHSGPPALPPVSLLQLCECWLEKTPPMGALPCPLSIAELQGKGPAVLTQPGRCTQQFQSPLVWLPTSFFLFFF